MDDLDLHVPHIIPPAGGTDPVPHVQQFQAIINRATKFYRNPDEAYRDSRANARAMENDPVVMTPLRQRQLATALLSWFIEPPDPKDATQQYVTGEMTKIVEAIPNFLQYRMNLLNAIFWGKWAIFNQYEWQFPKGKKRMMVKRWLPIHGDSLKFSFEDDHMAILSFSGGGGDGVKNIEPLVATDEARAKPINNWQRLAYVVHRHEIATADFFDAEAAGRVTGIGVRSQIFWCYYLCSEIRSWMVEFSERLGLGLTIYEFEEGNEASFKAASEAAASESFASRIVWPVRTMGQGPQPGIKRIEPNPGGIQAIREVINDFAEQIQKYIVGQTLLSDTGPSGQGSGVAEQHYGSFSRIIKYDSINLAETITRELISVLMRYNFPDADFELKFRINMAEPDPEKLMKAATAFHQLGGDLDEAEVRAIAGFSAPVKGAKVLKGRDIDRPMVGQGYSESDTKEEPDADAE
jgi:hypothetical protein